MTIPKQALELYKKQLSRISEECANEVLAYIENGNLLIDDRFIEFCNAIQTKYGEAASALACQLYDELAVYAGKSLSLAEPAATATMQETAKTVYGTAKRSMTEIPQAVALLAKRAAEDTTLQNALRDGAYFAWVPSGDTCAFCRMLGANGFRRMSKKALRNGHAEHIHANCDCTYVVRFDNKMQYEGYDPDALYEDYKASGGLRGMERNIYEQNKDAINARRRQRYAAKKLLEEGEE